jgi:WS/DGAT/MGAT family acyltransferase
VGYQRLSAQDASFLHIENPVQPQHVGALGVFEGGSFFDASGRFRLDDVRALIASRLHLVPRFRQRVMEVPFDQGRPVWVDDDRFDLTYHVRLTALPRPGTRDQLKALMGRLQSQVLDRSRPLWELWFVEGLEGGHVALIQKTHHCMVDGISGVDVALVLLDFEPDPPRVEPPGWRPEPAPTPGQLMMESMVERISEPVELFRSVVGALRGPVAERVATLSRAATTAAQPAPPTPWNVPIGSHRRWEDLPVPLDQAKAIKDAAGVSLNDVVLAACTGALRRFLQSRGEAVDGLMLRALVPVSVRSEDERGHLGNRVSMMTAELPVGLADPADRLRAVSEHMRAVKESGEAVGAATLIEMTNYLPPTLLIAGSRLIVRSRAVNLGITNVPGPQAPLYCMGARLLEAYPYVPIVDGQALTIGVISYDGSLAFGITGDRDVLPDLRVIADGIEHEFAALRTPAVATKGRKVP